MEFFKLILTVQVPLMFFCDQTMDGGGWIVFQRKRRGSYNFKKDWNAYKNGFGNLSEDFWLGLDKIHRLTSRSHLKLNIYRFWSSTGQDWTESNSFHSFKVQSEEKKYALELDEAGNDEPFAFVNRD